MMEETLFSNNVKRPLADRLRPQSLKEVVGQEHIVGDDAPLGRMIKSGKITSFILPRIQIYILSRFPLFFPA